MKSTAKSLRDGSVSGAVERNNSSRFNTIDCLFLSVIGAISVSYYILGLGFYSDDWALLASMRLPNDQSFINIFAELVRAHDHEIRPIQFLELAGLYKIFGLAPLGYHLVNAAIIIAASLTLDITLRALGMSRIFALSICVVYLLLPNYSTDRFWIAAAAANVSMLLFFWVLTPICRPPGIVANERYGGGNWWPPLP